MRIAARWSAGLLTAGLIAVGGITPAQADTGWNGTSMPAHAAETPKNSFDTGWSGSRAAVRPPRGGIIALDTGWNGT